jgi:hypothetical protein
MILLSGHTFLRTEIVLKEVSSNQALHCLLPTFSSFPRHTDPVFVIVELFEAKKQRNISGKHVFRSLALGPHTKPFRTRAGPSEAWKSDKFLNLTSSVQSPMKSYARLDLTHPKLYINAIVRFLLGTLGSQKTQDSISPQSTNILDTKNSPRCHIQ